MVKLEHASEVILYMLLSLDGQSWDENVEVLTLAGN